MNYIDKELLEKAEQLKAECGAAAAYQFLVDVINLELQQSKRSGEQ